jgi:hypothetical protein
MPASRERQNTLDHAPKRGPQGQWLPGSSPNPGGRPKIIEDIRDLAREHTETAINALVQIAESGKQESARVAAASALLDRGWGKPTQPIAGDDAMPAIGINGTAVATLTAEERAALVAGIAESLRAAS